MAGHSSRDRVRRGRRSLALAASAIPQPESSGDRMKKALKFAVATLAALALIALLSGRASAAYPNLGIQNQWTWFEDDVNWPMSCLDGSNTGYGYYFPSNWNGDVLFMFDGGGYCYDAASCAVNATTNPAVSGLALLADAASYMKPPAGDTPFVMQKHYQQFHDSSSNKYPSFQDDTTLTGLSAPDGNGNIWSKPRIGRGILDPSPSNPFSRYMMVFVPYCTGDLHIGNKDDTSPSTLGRAFSNMHFHGIVKSYYTFYTALVAAVGLTGHVPPRILLTGGSAGGFGADMLAPLLRETVGPSSAGTQIVTVSDSGMPLYEGSSSNGTTWTRQGFFQRPNLPETTVSSIGEWMYDAWGGDTWATFFANPALKKASMGDGYAYVSMHDAEQYQWLTRVNPSSTNYNDKFAIVDSTSDWLYPIFFQLYMNDDPTTSHTPHVIDAENELNGDFALGFLFQVTNTGTTGETPAALVGVPWNKHHTFILDDVSTWGPSGSNLNQLWANLGLP
jgi:hypothetical protein